MSSTTEVAEVAEQVINLSVSKETATYLLEQFHDGTVAASELIEKLFNVKFAYGDDGNLDSANNWAHISHTSKMHHIHR